MERKGEYTCDNIKDHFKFSPGTIVSLTLKIHKGKVVNKDFKVEKDYGSYILFTDIENNRKLSITKIDFITGEIKINEPKQKVS